MGKRKREPDVERLLESREAEVRLLESDQPGICRFEAIVSEGDYINQNGRKYPASVLKQAFEQMNAQIALHPGTVDHPDPWAPVSIADIGIKWEEFWADPAGLLWYGRGRTVDTRKGQDLRAALEAGIPLGFSTRGFGKGHEEQLDGKTVYVIDEFTFARGSARGGVDAVLTPSVAHARVTDVRKEDVDSMEEQLEEARANLETARRELAEAQAAAASAQAERDAAREQITQLEAARDGLQAELDTLRAEKGAAEVEARLLTLTQGHRFGPSIAAAARKIGVTAENLEAVVAAATELVEGAASAAALTGEQRGQLDNKSEDAPQPTVKGGKPIEDLKQMGLF